MKKLNQFNRQCRVTKWYHIASEKMRHPLLEYYHQFIKITTATKPSLFCRWSALENLGLTLHT